MARLAALRLLRRCMIGLSRLGNVINMSSAERNRGMKFVGRCLVVCGNSEYVDIPDIAIRSGLLNRIAVVCRPTMAADGDDWGYGYREWYRSYVRMLCVRYKAKFVIDNLSPELSIRRFELESKDDPPKMVLFKQGENIVAVLETEPWYLVGGEQPYSDSYTFSLYHSAGDDVVRACLLSSFPNGWTVEWKVRD